jgi:hypothetical protein
MFLQWVYHSCSQKLPRVVLLNNKWAYNRSASFSIALCFSIFHPPPKYICFVWAFTKFFTVVSIVFIDGFIKPHTPGSLREPAVTYLFPANWLTLPLSFGLLVSPWGGHSVFPNIYRDMRHPYKFKRAVKVTFTFTVSLHRQAGVQHLTKVFSTFSTVLLL